MEPSEPKAAATMRLVQVDAVLERFFSLAKKNAVGFGDSYLRLWQTLEASAAGGKRFRPRLVMAAYRGLGGADEHAAAYVGAAFELLHTALIVHDDVIDRDFTRRGNPNVSGSYRDIATTAGIPIPIAEHRGMSVAVIAGDLALVNAYRLIDRSGVNDEVRERLLELMDAAITASAAGELLDVDFSMSAEPPAVDEVLRMERLKTAVYTFEAPLQAGAVLAGASDEIVAALGDFGCAIGIAYQVRDDLLGVFGDEKLTGKTTVGDLREGKRTAITAYAATTDAWASIRSLVGKPSLTMEQAGYVRSVLEECGARAFAEGIAVDYAASAMDQLGAMSPELQAELRSIVREAAERQR